MKTYCSYSIKVKSAHKIELIMFWLEHCQKYNCASTFTCYNIKVRKGVTDEKNTRL